MRFCCLVVGRRPDVFETSGVRHGGGGHSGDAGDQLQRVLDSERLVQIAVDSMLGLDLAKAQLFGPRANDDLDIGIQFSQPLECFGAIELGHVVIQKDQLYVLLVLGEEFESLDRAGGGFTSKPAGSSSSMIMLRKSSLSSMAKTSGRSAEGLARVETSDSIWAVCRSMKSPVVPLILSSVTAILSQKEQSKCQS